jgi:hypothetical protein
MTGKATGVGKGTGKRTRFSRRAALGIGAAAVAVPAALYARWATQGFVRPGYDAEPPPAPPGRVDWSNWSGAVRATPRSIAVARDEAEVARIVASSPGPIRPVGSGHSFVSLASSEGTMIDVSPLAGVLTDNPAAGTVTFAAGTRLQHAARLLAERGLAFPNLSDIDTQTLAGLFSTSTHGTGRTLKALHDVIEGFRIVTASGETRDVTAQSDPDLFAAGKVSLGALGVMTAFTIRPVKAFKLRRRVTAADIEAIYPQLDALAEAHRNFEIYYLPGIGKAAIITHDIFEGEVAGRADSDDDEILQGLKTLRDQLGWWPWLRRMVALAELPSGVIHVDLRPRRGGRGLRRVLLALRADLPRPRRASALGQDAFAEGEGSSGDPSAFRRLRRLAPAHGPRRGVPEPLSQVDPRSLT